MSKSFTCKENEALNAHALFFFTWVEIRQSESAYFELARSNSITQIEPDFLKNFVFYLLFQNSLLCSNLGAQGLMSEMDNNDKAGRKQKLCLEGFYK